MKTQLLFQEKSGFIKVVFLYFLYSLSIAVNAQFTVHIDTTEKYQVFKGFGAAWSINSNFLYTNKTMRQEWDNFGRVNVRAGVMSDSNFIPSKADLDANNYSFTNSELYNYALYLKEAKKWGLNRAVVEIFSPPGWMKSGGKSLCFPCTDAENYLLPEHYSDYAKWAGILAKEIIKICGDDIDFWLSLQNEPRFHEEWPKCIYNPTNYAAMLKVVGEYFQTNDTLKKVNLFGPTDMGLWPTQVPWMDTLLDVKPEAGAYLKGWGNQGYMDGVNPNIGDTNNWTKFADRIIDQHGKELWMSSGAMSYTEYNQVLDFAKHVHMALKQGRVSCFHYWGIGMFIEAGSLNLRGQMAKTFFRFIPPGHTQFMVKETEKDFLMMGFKNGNNVTITCLNDNASESKTFTMDADLAPFYHVYAMTNKEQMCNYKGKMSGNTFTVQPKGLLTLYYNANDTIGICSPPPVIVKAENITSNSVTLSWSGSNKWTMKGYTNSYDVKMLPDYKIARNYDYSNSKTTKDTTFTYTGLKSCTEYSFTIVTTDSLFNQSMATVIVKTTGENCNAIEFDTKENLPNVSVYPNPTSNQLFIENPGMIYHEAHLLNLMGNTIKVIDLRNEKISVDVSTLQSGVYFLRFVNEGTATTVKIMIK